MKHPQLTHSIIMCQPDSFGYNSQTGSDNEFQHRSDLASNEVTARALNEFANSVERLRAHGLEVLVLEHHDGINRPDAVFPNNWFTTHPNGEVLLYPMKTPNRQREVVPEQLRSLLQQNGYHVSKMHPSADICQGIVEGTGAMVFDHVQQQVYAALSERCEHRSLLEVATYLDYTPVVFTANSQHNTPIYHTNVMMSVGEDFAVVCLDSITQAERNSVLAELEAAAKQVITITAEQCEQSFCANILQVKSAQNEPLILLSKNALNGFSAAQRVMLERHGQLVDCNIATIEHIGGGSLRCMVAENFLPRQID
ncbi:MAG: hypothetical protein HWE13_04295 [Gammaproteobacteria bacterium]|nr:hypothetical protein [Gammaproteobacteria bacterium]